MRGGEGGFTSVLPRGRVAPPARPPGLCLRLEEEESGKRRRVFPLYKDNAGKGCRFEGSLVQLPWSKEFSK